MTTPIEAAKGLGKAMKAHIKHGIAGMTNAQIDSLEKRGIIEESERKPGYLDLSPLGMCVRTMLHGFDPANMSDEQRIRYRELHLEFAAEWEDCDRHPGHGQVYEWVWDIPKNGNHYAAIECSEPSIVRGCPLCNAEAEARWADDCE